ncbi:MAG: type II toxin-antitoxin system RelE/ParE family toxin [Coriobacteriales bacterium]|jgi:plasmid stabilization system protein ParE
MAYSCKILETARLELENIARYLVVDAGSPKAAGDFLDEFDRLVEDLAVHPLRFALSRMPELAAQGYRCALVGSYAILFKVVEDVVYIAHIFHQRQDYAQLV